MCVCVFMSTCVKQTRMMSAVKRVLDSVRADTGVEQKSKAEGHLRLNVQSSGNHGCKRHKVRLCRCAWRMAGWTAWPQPGEDRDRSRRADGLSDHLKDSGFYPV